MRTVFDLSALRASIASARELAAMPEHAPEGWSLHPSDPARIVDAFPPLQVRVEYRLVAYQYRAGGNGNAVVYALPHDAPVPPPEECPRDEEAWLTPPVPSGALPDVRLAFEGDGSPQAYLAASLAWRELGEMGAAWHGAGWSTHELIGAHPLHDRATKRHLARTVGGFGRGALAWHGPPVAEWAPHVDVRSDAIIVRFHTVSCLELERIVEHEDRYVPGSLMCESTTTDVATGGMGYIH